jgi:hypothetical protein
VRSSALFRQGTGGRRGAPRRNTSRCTGTGSRRRSPCGTKIAEARDPWLRLRSMDASLAPTVLGTLATPRRAVLEVGSIMQLPILAVLAAAAAQAGETRAAEGSALPLGGMELIGRFEDARLGQVARAVCLEPRPLQGAIDRASFRSETRDVLERFSRGGLPGKRLRKSFLDDDLRRPRGLAPSPSSPTAMAALRDERAPTSWFRKDGFAFGLPNSGPSAAALFGDRQTVTAEAVLDSHLFEVQGREVHDARCSWMLSVKCFAPTR